MGSSQQRIRLLAKRRVLAATGLAATAAVGGVGLAASGAQAASDGVVHACYSKSTKQLKFSRKTKCPKGSKLVTWQKTGSQGPQGAAGVRGPAGSTTGWADERYGVTSHVALSKGVLTVVAEFTPSSSGYFDVTGFANVNDNHDYEAASCTDIVDKSDYTPAGIAPVAPDGVPVDTITTGIVQAGPTKPVYEDCYLKSDSGQVYAAGLTGIRLTAAHVAQAKAATRYVPGAAIERSASNRFSKR